MAAAASNGGTPAGRRTVIVALHATHLLPQRCHPAHPERRTGRGSAPTALTSHAKRPGQQRSKVLPRLLEDQRKVAALAVAGAALQALGAVCAFIAASR